MPPSERRPFDSTYRHLGSGYPIGGDAISGIFRAASRAPHEGHLSLKLGGRRLDLMPPAQVAIAVGEAPEEARIAALTATSWLRRSMPCAPR